MDENVGASDFDYGMPPAEGIQDSGYPVGGGEAFSYGEEQNDAGDWGVQFSPVRTTGLEDPGDNYNDDDDTDEGDGAYEEEEDDESWDSEESLHESDEEETQPESSTEPEATVDQPAEAEVTQEGFLDGFANPEDDFEADPFPLDSEIKDDNWSPQDWGIKAESAEPSAAGEDALPTDAAAAAAAGAAAAAAAGAGAGAGAAQLQLLWWQCTVCNVLNTGADCRACLTPKQSASSLFWECNVCHAKNEQTRKNCKACGSKNYRKVIIIGAAPRATETSTADQSAEPSTAAQAPDMTSFVNKVFNIEGKRMRLERKDAKLLVTRLEKEGQHNAYRKIRLSTRSLTIPAAEVFAEHIQRMTNLSEADLSDIISGIETEEAYEVYRILNRALSCLVGTLKHVDVSDNALGPKIDAFPDIITWRLHSVKVNNTGLSAAGCRILTDMILKSMAADGKDSCELRVIEHFNSCSDFEGAMHISRLLGKCPLLEGFRMESIRAHEAALTVIQMLGRYCPRLQRICIADNNFKINSGEKLSALTAALTNFHELRVLDFHDLPFEFEGACAAIGVVLSQSCPELTCVNLNNSLEHDTEALAALFGGISRCHSLNEIHLEGCELEDTGATCLTKFLMDNKPKLRQLNVKTNQLSSVAAIALVRALIVTGATGSLAARGLELDENDISATGLERIRTLLESVGHQHILAEVDTNGIDDEDLPPEPPAVAPPAAVESTRPPCPPTTSPDSPRPDSVVDDGDEPDSQYIGTDSEKAIVKQLQSYYARVSPTKPPGAASKLASRFKSVKKLSAFLLKHYGVPFTPASEEPEENVDAGAVPNAAPDAEAALFSEMCNECNTDDDDDDDEDYVPEDETFDEESYFESKEALDHPEPEVRHQAPEVRHQAPEARHQEPEAAIATSARGAVQANVTALDPYATTEQASRVLDLSLSLFQSGRLEADYSNIPVEITVEAQLDAHLRQTFRVVYGNR